MRHHNNNNNNNNNNQRPKEKQIIRSQETIQYLKMTFIHLARCRGGKEAAERDAKVLDADLVIWWVRIQQNREVA